ncbi:MAG: transcriptional regulator [Nitrososphaerales archaeon]
MILPYEIIHRSAVPAIRYMVAKKLIEEHSFTQKEAADKLRVTQAAISNYLRRTRAVAVKLDNNRKICSSVKELTDMLLDGDPDRPEVVEKITDICDYMRKNRLLCNFHKKMEPSYNTEECHACDEPFKVYF